jgi:Dyp-type peroxidase family
MAVAVQQHDLQGNILCGYGRRFAYGLYLFLVIEERSAAAGWLHALSGQVTSAARWRETPRHTVNVAFTHAGLRAFGLSGDQLRDFSADFRDGMAKRSGRLGDVGPSAPECWERGLGDSHVLVSARAASAGGRDALQAQLAVQAAEHRLAVVYAQRTALLDGGREHFGFRDDISQPAINDPHAGPERRTPAQGEVLPGEFVLGYPDEGGSQLERSPLLVNGSYQVVRKLEQDVPAFTAFLRREAGAERARQELLAAKLVGRWPDGTPLVRSPDAPRPRDAADLGWANDFGYADDADGRRCPLGAHVRRTNPRDAFDEHGHLTMRHRIIRRGMPYEPEADGERGGLVFASFQASIERQFEFMQAQWCNDGNAFGLGDDPDVFSGRDDGKMTIQGSVPHFVPLQRFVRLRGGDYFFAPGLAALRKIARFADG